MQCASSWPREINRKWELARQVGWEGVATESAFSVRRQPIPRSNWLLRLWQTHLSLPPSGCLPKVYVCMCVCVCEGAGRLKRATEAASNSNPMSSQPSHSHTLLTHTLSSAPALASTLGHRRRRRRGEEREAASGREGEWGRGSKRGEREREAEGDWRGVRENTMASDPGLAAMLLWTISLQAVGTAGTNSNEGRRVCVCVCVRVCVCVCVSAQWNRQS